MRNFIFGAEDSLVSTVGLLAGITVGGVERSSIILTGIVLIFVEAFSMGVGSFLSESEAEEYLEGTKPKSDYSFTAGLVMFLSYVVMGMVPLWPYMAMDTQNALICSLISSLIALFVLGIVSAKILHIRQFRSAIRMLVVGGLAIVVGMAVAKIVS